MLFGKGNKYPFIIPYLMFGSASTHKYILWVLSCSQILDAIASSTKILNASLHEEGLSPELVNAVFDESIEVFMLSFQKFCSLCRICLLLSSNNYECKTASR